MSKEKSFEEIKEVIENFTKEISTPEVQVNINEKEYEKIKKSENLLSAQLMFTVPYCGKPLTLCIADCLEKVLKDLPEGYDARLIKNNDKKYPDDSVVGEIFTTQNIGFIPGNTVVCVFTVFGQMKFFEHLSCCISYENGSCAFKLDTYEELLMHHEQTFVKKLFKYSDDNAKTSSELAESYIENTARKKITEKYQKGHEFVYFNNKNEMFAKCFKIKSFEDQDEYLRRITTAAEYTLYEFPSLFELSAYMRETRSVAVALALIEGYLKKSYGKRDSRDKFTHLSNLPKGIVFRPQAIYLNDKVIVNCEKPINEVIDEIFKVSNLLNLELNIKNYLLYKKRTNIGLYKELVAFYTNLSSNLSNAYWLQYDIAFDEPDEERKHFFQAEFLKQAIINVLEKDSPMLYDKIIERTKTAKIVKNFEYKTKVIQSINNVNVYVIRFFGNGKDYDVGRILLGKKHQNYMLTLYEDEINELANILFSDVSLEELIEEYFSPKVNFHVLWLDKWGLMSHHLRKITIECKLTDKKSIKTEPNEYNRRKILNQNKTVGSEMLKNELLEIGKLALPFGKAKKFFGITIAGAYDNPSLYDWFVYICTKREGTKFLYTGYYPDKMRRYFDIVKQLNIR